MMKITLKDYTWEEWRANNMRIAMQGGTLYTNWMENGDVEFWAELDGESWRNDPPQHPAKNGG